MVTPTKKASKPVSNTKYDRLLKKNAELASLDAMIAEDEKKWDAQIERDWIIPTQMGEAWPKEAIVQALESDSLDILGEILRLGPQPPPGAQFKDAILARFHAFKLQGDRLLAREKFGEARVNYVEAVEGLLGKIPHRAAFWCDHYLEVPCQTLWGAAPLACLGAARCMYEQKDYATALQYVSEVEVLHLHGQLLCRAHIFDWMDYNINMADAYRSRLISTELSSDIFDAVGNTAAAAESRWKQQTIDVGLPPIFRDNATRGVRPPQGLSSQRHPDPHLIHKLEVVDPTLQIRGSWKKMSTRGMSSRSGTAVVVHDGYLYSFGGEKSNEGPYYPELYRINLERMGKWERLPEYPFAGKLLTKFYTGARMVVDPKDSRAYLFFGDLEMPYFDMKNQSWGIVRTIYKSSEEWPYSTQAHDYAMQYIAGKLYVFGGIHDASPVGTDLLMCLDLETLAWTHLSGEREPFQANLKRPGPREYPSSWVGKGGKKLYIMHGDADRLGAKLANKDHASTIMYDYDDLWSWDVEAKTWNKERITGNRPPRRTEIACVYNPVLDKVIAFGGYSPRVMTHVPETGQAFNFSYYADTFMLDSDDPSVSSWKLVMTRGFPIYRAESQLVVDASTGKTYLFSGYTNAQYVPGQNHLCSRKFTDIWQLRLDVEGGYFEDVDADEEMRTAKAGPWQRCFSCGSAGLWKKCGGSCRGKVYFCNIECQKEGWSAHKESHGCHKV